MKAQTWKLYSIEDRGKIYIGSVQAQDYRSAIKTDNHRHGHVIAKQLEFEEDKDFCIFRPGPTGEIEPVMEKTLKYFPADKISQETREKEYHKIFQFPSFSLAKFLAKQNYGKFARPIPYEKVFPIVAT